MAVNQYLNRVRLEERVNFVLAALIIIITISPPLRVGILYYLSITFCSTLWLLTAFILKSDFFFTINKMESVIVFMFITMTGIMLLFGNMKYWKLEVGLFLYYFIVIIFCFYRKYYKKYLYKLMWITLSIVPLWCIITIRALLFNPYIARSISEGSAANELNRQGVGGYGLVYMSTIIGVCCFIAFLKVKNISCIKKLIMFANIILCMSLAALSGFALSIISIIVCIFGYLLLNKTKHGKVKVGFVLLSIVVVVVVALNAYTILYYLLEITINTSNHSKIYDFYQYLQTGVLGDTFVARLNAYTVSLETFSKNWVIGLMSTQNLNLTWDNYGGHSAILDGFSLYGTGVGLLNLYILLIIPVQLFKDNKYKKTSLPFGVLLSVILVLLLNNISDMYAVAITIVLYCCVEMICGENNNIEQKN